MTDELFYLKLAQGIADGWPALRGDRVAPHGILYPLLIAPLVGSFGAASSFTAIHYLNVFLLASAAVPAYLLARAVTKRPPLGLIVAAGTVCVPYLAAASKFTTEPLAYPMFTWAVLAIVTAVAHPSRRAELLALSAITLAYLTRTQFIYLFVLLPVIGVAHGALYRPRSIRAGVLDGIGRHRISVSAAGLVAAVLVVAPTLLLGNYAVTASGGTGGLLPDGVIHSSVVHAGTLALQLGGLTVPLALAFAVATLLQPGVRERHCFAITLLAVGATSIYVAAAFDTRFVGALSGIEPSEIVRERYLIYLVPIALTGAAAFFADAARWRWRAASGAAVAGALTALTIESASVRTDALIPSFDSPGRIFNIVIVGRVAQLRDISGIDRLQPGALAMALTIAGLGVIAVAIWRGHDRLATYAVLGLVFSYLVAETWYVVPRVYYEQNTLSFYLGPRTAEQRTWIDRSVGDRSVGMLASTVTARGTTPYLSPYLNGALWWDAEFWNSRVDTYYIQAGLDLTLPPYRRATVDRAAGSIASAGQRTDYLVVTQKNPSFQIAGEPERRQGDLALYRVDWPVRLTWASADVFPDGWTNSTSDADPRLDLFGPRGTRLDVSVLLSNGPTVDDKPRVVEISLPGAATRRVRVDAATAVRVVTCKPSDRPLPIGLRSPGTVDGARRIGVRIASVTVTARRSCEPKAGR